MKMLLASYILALLASFIAGGIVAIKMQQQGNIEQTNQEAKQSK